MTRPNVLRHLAILVPVVLLAAAGTAALLYNLERVSEPVYVGLRGEAGMNPFLAAERLLSAREYPVRTYHHGFRLNRLDDRVSAVFLFPELPSPDPQIRDAALTWVENGGTLFCMLDPNVDPVGGTQISLSAFIADAFDVTAGPIDAEDGAERTPGAAEVRFGSDRYLVDLDTRINIRVESPLADWRAGEDGGSTQALRIPWGKGQLYVLGRPRFLTNGVIGTSDNAPFLGRLLENARTGELWLLRDPQLPRLPALLLRYAFRALAAGILFFAAVVLSRAPRFGPIREAVSPQRRVLRQRLLAVGRLFHRSRALDRLLEAVRKETLHSFGPRFAGPPEDSSGRTAKSLRTRGLNDEEIRLLISGSGPLRSREFLHRVKALEIIRREKGRS